MSENESEKFFFSEDEQDIFDISEGEHTPSWSIPWSDLTFILFILLLVYSINLVDLQNKNKTKELEDNKSLVTYNEIKSPNDREDIMLLMLSKKISSNFKNISVDFVGNQAVKISMHGPLLFDTGKADVKPATKKFLQDFSDILRDTDYKIFVQGNTDNVPMKSDVFQSNWELSAVRAVRVARFFIEKQGIDPKRITIVGNSEFNPIVPNTSNDFKAKNRRVEIVITRESIF